MLHIFLYFYLYIYHTVKKQSQIIVVDITLFFKKEYTMVCYRMCVKYFIHRLHNIKYYYCTVKMTTNASMHNCLNIKHILIVSHAFCCHMTISVMNMHNSREGIYILCSRAEMTVDSFFHKFFHKERPEKVNIKYLTENSA